MKVELDFDSVVLDYAPKPKITKAIVLNLSGHRLPDSTMKWLMEQGFRSSKVTTYSQPVSVDFNKDLWLQVEAIVKELASKPGKEDNVKNCFQHEAAYFIVLPACSTVACLLLQGITRILGHEPKILFVQKDENEVYNLKQVINLSAFNQKFRNFWRAVYVLEKDEEELQKKIEANKAST